MKFHELPFMQEWYAFADNSDKFVASPEYINLKLIWMIRIFLILTLLVLFKTLRPYNCLTGHHNWMGEGTMDRKCRDCGIEYWEYWKDNLEGEEKFRRG